jgi:hypothetical protein
VDPEVVMVRQMARLPVIVTTATAVEAVGEGSALKVEEEQGDDDGERGERDGDCGGGVGQCSSQT